MSNISSSIRTATLGFRLEALRKAFGTDRALAVTPDRIAKYVSDRLAQKKARATVNP
jgi:hypothetical protein